MVDIKRLSSYIPSASLHPLALYFHDYQNDLYKQLIRLWFHDTDTDHVRLNPLGLLFWTTCVATMAGCGLLSIRLFRRSDIDRPLVRKRHHRTNTNLTVTSSEDDSDGCLTPTRTAAVVNEKQSATAYRRFSPNGAQPFPIVHRVHKLTLFIQMKISTPVF